MKGDHGMDRNHLKGRHGDQFNVNMAAIGYNFRRLLQWLQDFVQFLISLWHAIIGLTVRTAGC
jgi:IS5 family transposase